MAAVKIPLNLSSEPFRRDRPILVASAATGALLLVVLAMLVTIIYNERQASKESRAMLEKLELQLRGLGQEQARLQAQLTQPANATVLDRSAFYNALIQRKAVSWTRLYSDLEQVFPGNVRLVTVRPFLTGDDRIQLDMIVGSQSAEPVVELLRKLESSPVFGSTTLISSQPPSQNEPLYRYRVSVNYAQKL